MRGESGGCAFVKSVGVAGEVGWTLVAFLTVVLIGMSGGWGRVKAETHSVNDVIYVG